MPEPDPLWPDHICAADFDQQIAALNRWFTVLSLREAVSRLRNGTLPPRSACVTFDDGYADNATVAFPILCRHRIPATFFVATGFLDGGIMWNDVVIETIRRTQGGRLDARCIGLGTFDISSLDLRQHAIKTVLTTLKYLPLEERQKRAEQFAARTALPTDFMMTSDQVRLLHESGMEIGAHTVAHPILAQLEPTRALREICDSKRRLEAITDSPIELFAYPNGKPRRDYRHEHIEMVKGSGFTAAVSTARGVAHTASDLFQLPRFTPWDRKPGKFILRLLQNTFRTQAEQV